MFNEYAKTKGEVTLALHDEFGRLKCTHTRNLLVAVGKAFITSLMIGTTPAVMSHMAVGSGTTEAVVGDTTLQTELGRVVLTSGVQVTTTTTSDAVEYTATFPAGVGTGSLTEAGLFNAASGGTLLARTVFGVITKGALDSLTVTWKITFI